MKLKEISRTANVTWSPAQLHPTYLACGTAAQQLDATFSTTAALELYQLKLTESGLNMTPEASIETDYRFHKLAWSSMDDFEHGVIAGGCDGGNMMVYDVSKMLMSESSLILHKDKHVGPVRALDFNPFQKNLLASGGSDSELFLWDLNNPTTPMTAGGKSQPLEDITCTAWNKQVEHILASTFSARCVVWDLRKNEPIIKISDSSSRMHCKVVAWNPTVATQMCLASEDDQTPIIQLWDLRFAGSPLKTLKGHQRGILSLAWCPQDSDLLLSCGKDNRIICWNPSSDISEGEKLCDMPTNQWAFDVSWCPRNPAVISSASFDGHVTIYSLMGGQQQVLPSTKITDSFPGIEALSQDVLPQSKVYVQLTKAPKWLRRPCGATFAFGGKLVYFGYEKPKSVSQSTVEPTQVVRSVQLAQVVSEWDLIEKSDKLQEALHNRQLCHFSNNKCDTAVHSNDKLIWSFLRDINGYVDPRYWFLQNLGFRTEVFTEELNDAYLKITGTTVTEAASAAFSSCKQTTDAITEARRTPAPEHSAYTQTTDAVTEARRTPAPEHSAYTQENSDIFGSAAISATADISGTADSSANAKTISQNEERTKITSARTDIISQDPVRIKPGNDMELDGIDLSCSFLVSTENGENDYDGLLTKLLLVGDLYGAVDLCFQLRKFGDAFLIAMAGNSKLLAQTQRLYIKYRTGHNSRLMSALVSGTWQNFIMNCRLECWKEAFAAIITYTKEEELCYLSGLLGDRLESSALREQALVCYICARNLVKFVTALKDQINKKKSVAELQDLIEKVMVMKTTVGLNPDIGPLKDGPFGASIVEYANILVSQGNLNTALVYLEPSEEENIKTLRHRLCVALGYRETPGSFSPQAVQPVKSNLVSQRKVSHGNVPPVFNNLQRNPTPKPTSSGFQNPAPIILADASCHAPGFNNPSFYARPQVSSVPTAAQTLSGTQRRTHLVDPTMYATDPSHTYRQAQYAYSTDDSSYGGYPPLPQPNMNSQHVSRVTPVPPVNEHQFINGSTQPGVNIYTPKVSAVKSVSNSPSLPSSGTRMSHPKESMPLPYTPANGSSSSSWNDPPKMKQKKLLVPCETPPPITHPIYGSDSGEINPDVPLQQTMQQAAYQYSEKNSTPSSKHGPSGSSSRDGSDSFVSAQSQVHKPSLPPIPIQHEAIQVTLEAFYRYCAQHTRSSHNRKKLEDIRCKLEILFSLIQRQALADTVMLGLSQFTEFINEGLYDEALAVHGQMIDGGNFAEMASFMPALKGLVHIAILIKRNPNTV